MITFVPYLPLRFGILKKLCPIGASRVLGQPRKKQETMKKQVSVPFMLLGILFNVCLITANLLEIKVISIFGITITAGLLVFPISYIINDCIVEVWGFRKARLIIWSGFAMNFFVVLMGQIAVNLPAAPFWEGENSFNFVFNMAPRIVLASLMAFVVGSFLNAFVMSKMKIAHGGKYFSLRAILSTFAGETADSLIFFPSHLADFLLVGTFYTNGQYKSCSNRSYGGVAHYRARSEKIKEWDNCDTFDEGILVQSAKNKGLLKLTNRF